MKRILRFIKQHPFLYELLRYGVYARLSSINRKAVFRKVYEKNLWDGEFSISGPGSTLNSTQSIREALPGLVAALGARSFLDIPCGDFQWMKHVQLGVDKYIGADIVFPLIQNNRVQFGNRGEFIYRDLLSDSLPAADIIFCRDCLVHLSFHEIQRALRNIRQASAKYLLTTTFPEHTANMDTVSPYWRPLNMQLSPFNFSKPLYLIKDFDDSQRDHEGKYLGVWRSESLWTIRKGPPPDGLIE